LKRHPLFLRIFLWFLGAMLLMAAVSVSLTVFMSRQGIILTGHQEVLSDALDRHGRNSWKPTRRRARPQRSN